MNVFVYGTLREGQRLHDIIKDYIAYSNIGYVHGAKMYDLTNGSYPHVVLTKDNKDIIIGEIIKFKPVYEAEAFKIMDRIELSAGYDRETVEVLICDLNQSNDEVQSENAAIYVINNIDRKLSYNKTAKIVECGDWVEYKYDIRKYKKS